MSSDDRVQPQSTEPEEAPNRAARRARRKGKKRTDTGSALPGPEPHGRAQDQVLVHRQFTGRRGNR